MPNSVSAKKELRKSQNRRSLNRQRVSRIKTFVKKLLKLIDSGDKSSAVQQFPAVQSEIARGVTKGVFKQNKASNMVSSLSSKLKAMCLGTRL